ncbi:MAG TPA: WecB/TagA/CpsF family glycosyltransferase, partial [Rhodothermales bacterium]
MITGAHSSDLRERARTKFQHRKIRGFSTFAPHTDALVELAGEATGLLVAVNAEKFANANQTLQEIVNANVAYPDGMGAVLALRRLGIGASRVAGADLWQRIVDRYAGDKRIHLIGARHAVIEAVAVALRARYPAISL